MEQRHISIATLVAVLLVGLVAAYGAFRPGPAISGFAPQGVSNFDMIHLAAPTAVGTATPALLVNQAGVSQVGSFQDGGTELLGIRNGGGVVVSAATAVATAQPALQVDSSGGVSNLFEVRDSATPVYQIHDGGNVTGKVLRYATAGQQMVVGTSTGVTETVVANHGLTTVTFALCTLGEDVDTDADDPVVCTASVAANVVTIKLWEDDWSAAGTAATVHWLVVGTP